MPSFFPNHLARGLTRLHARVWRALIDGDMASFEALRETLVSALEHCDLTLNHLAEVDAEIMIELLDVVISRYNRSQRTARAYHLALMQLAGRLGPRALRREGRRLPQGFAKAPREGACRAALDRTARPAPVEAAVQRRRQVVERLPGDVGRSSSPALSSGVQTRSTSSASGWTTPSTRLAM